MLSCKLRMGLYKYTNTIELAGAEVEDLYICKKICNL